MLDPDVSRADMAENQSNYLNNKTLLAFLDFSTRPDTSSKRQEELLAISLVFAIKKHFKPC